MPKINRYNRSKTNHRSLSWLRRLTSKQRFLLFAVIFASIGGYLVFRSIAATTLSGADGEFTAITPARI